MLKRLKITFWTSLLLLMVQGLFAEGGLDEIKKRYPIERQIRYSFTIKNSGREMAEKVEFWAYAPVKQTSSQYCKKLEASMPYRLITDGDGNQIMHFVVENLPAFGTKIINIKADLLLSEKSNRLPLKEKESFLAAEPLVESDHKAIIALAESFGQKSKIEQIFNWISVNIEDSGYLADDRGALYALEKRSGDCTEYMSLFVALSRASKIPARGIAGYVVKSNAILSPVGFHNWAEYYDKGAWHSADPQNGMLVEGQADYIATRIIRGEDKSVMKGFHRFRVEPSTIDVRM